jgi:HK97 family phage major capsid protein
VTLATKLKEASDNLDAKRKDLRAIFVEAGPDYDMDKITSLTGDSAAKVAEIRKRNEELDDLGKALDDLKAVQRAALAAMESGTVESGLEPNGDGAGTKGRQPEVKNLGQLFSESPAFKGYRPGQGIGPVAHLDIDLKTLFETGAGWAAESLRTGIVTLKPTRPAPHVVDFIPQVPTSQSAVKYREETTFTNAAAEAAEGGSYAESTLVLTERSETVRKVATFLPVTDEQFEDVDEAEAYVNNRLIFMVQQKLDAQVLVGSGTPPALKGTENVSGIQTQALGTDPIPDAIFKAMRAIRDDGFAEPGVVFIAPSKWQTVRLLRTADGIYIWGNPSEAGPERIWGVPVVQTTAHTATKAVIGDYAMHSALYVRRGVDVQVSNSHSTYFVEGKLAVRADVRVAMVHYRPKAFATVTGL